jgi:integrase
MARALSRATAAVLAKRPARHIARFLLVGAYTGTRAAAIGSAAFEPIPGHGWIDLKSGLYYRAEEGARETTKRQPTILVPRRLLMHLRRWKRLNPDQRFVVEFKGKAVGQVNKGFVRIVELAGLGPEVVPHKVPRGWCDLLVVMSGEFARFAPQAQVIDTFEDFI